MIETVLVILGFVLIAILAAVEVLNGLTIKRLKKVIDDLYFEVAVDRTEIYKEIEVIQDNYDVTQVEMKLLASRCNQCEGCLCKKDSTEEKKIPLDNVILDKVTKSKRPRKPRQ